jgi:hypothetical protein
MALKKMNDKEFCCVLECIACMSVLKYKYDLLWVISYSVYVRTLMTERYDEFVIVFKYDLSKGSISLMHRAREKTDDSSCRT